MEHIMSDAAAAGLSLASPALYLDLTVEVDC